MSEAMAVCLDCYLEDALKLDAFNNHYTFGIKAAETWVHRHGQPENMVIPLYCRNCVGYNRPDFAGHADLGRFKDGEELYICLRLVCWRPTCCMVSRCDIYMAPVVL